MRFSGWLLGEIFSATRTNYQPDISEFNVIRLRRAKLGLTQKQLAKRLALLNSRWQSSRIRIPTVRWYRSKEPCRCLALGWNLCLMLSHEHNVKGEVRVTYTSRGFGRGLHPNLCAFITKVA